MARELIVTDGVREFRRYKELAERAIAQLTDADFFRCLDGESNSIAMIMKHIAGNLRSRWTDIFSTDGEKPGRKRDLEFLIDPADSRASLLDRWNAGWNCLFDALDSLTADDMKKTVYIRGEPHSVAEAVQRALSHSAYHIGQIVFLAKHFTGNKWQTLSVPRGKSDEYFAAMRQKWEKHTQSTRS